MLSEAKLPNSFWAETLNIFAYVINLSPVVALDGDVPNRVWFDKDVSYDHLKVFGCKACVHVPKDERSKLDVKTKQCIFIGYGQDEFGYIFMIQLIRNSLEVVMLCFLKIKLSKILTRLRN